MSIKKVEKQLRKITNLVSSFEEDENISSIERDLLLSYTRSLYEKILALGDVDKAVVSNVPKVKPQVEHHIQEQPKPIVDNTIYAEKKMPVVEEQKSTVPEPVIQQPEEMAAVPLTSEVEKIVEVKTNENTLLAPELEEIFAEIQVNELSQRLSHSKIHDLTKAIGINEKIFTIQELFGGDNELYQTTINRLNTFTSYDEAKTYLANGVALDHQWSDANKLKKAMNFVKIVQRRYV